MLSNTNRTTDNIFIFLWQVTQTSLLSITRSHITSWILKFSAITSLLLWYGDTTSKYTLSHSQCTCLTASLNFITTQTRTHTHTHTMQIQVHPLTGGHTCPYLHSLTLAYGHHPTAHPYSPGCPLSSRLVVWGAQAGGTCPLRLLSSSGSNPTGSNTTSLPLEGLSGAWLILLGTVEASGWEKGNCNPLQIRH